MVEFPFMRVATWLFLLAGCGNHSSPAPAARRPVGPPQARFSEPASRSPASQASSASSVYEVEESATGWLGVAMTDRSVSEPGVAIRRVLRGSPAERAGLAKGDVVLAVNGRTVAGSQQLGSVISALGAGTRVTLAVKHRGEHRLLAAELIGNPGAEGQLRLGFVGAPAPAFLGLEVAQGNITERLADLKGQVVVLEFWASWCAACRALMPTLNDWHERMAPLGGQVVSITLDPLQKAARDAFQLGMRYPVLADPQGKTTRLYQAMALPTLFILDRQGIVRAVAVGYSPQRLEQLGVILQGLLTEG